MGIGVNYKVQLSADARAHAKEAAQYYKAISADLARLFKQELQEKLVGLQSFNGYAMRYKDYRRLNLNAFPYCIYFTVSENEALVLVVAIYHQKQQKAEFGPV